MLELIGADRQVVSYRLDDAARFRMRAMETGTGDPSLMELESPGDVSRFILIGEDDGISGFGNRFNRDGVVINAVVGNQFPISIQLNGGRKAGLFSHLIVELKNDFR